MLLIGLFWPRLLRFLRGFGASVDSGHGDSGGGSDVCHDGGELRREAGTRRLCYRMKGQNLECMEIRCGCVLTFIVEAFVHGARGGLKIEIDKEICHRSLNFWSVGIMPRPGFNVRALGKPPEEKGQGMPTTTETTGKLIVTRLEFSMCSKANR